MTLEANILRADSVRTTAQGYEIDVGLAWYRSLPLSCVENISIKIGGKDIAGADLRINYEGRELTLEELGELVDDWWFIQDPLTIQVADPAPLEKGSAVEVQVELATRIPYIIIGPEMALVQRTKADLEVTVQ